MVPLQQVKLIKVGDLCIRGEGADVEIREKPRNVLS